MTSPETPTQAAAGVADTAAALADQNGATDEAAAWRSPAVRAAIAQAAEALVAETQSAEALGVEPIGAEALAGPAKAAWTAAGGPRGHQNWSAPLEHAIEDTAEAIG